MVPWVTFLNITAFLIIRSAAYPNIPVSSRAGEGWREAMIRTLQRATADGPLSMSPPKASVDRLLLRP
jgi:hypothetical protein